MPLLPNIQWISKAHIHSFGNTGFPNLKSLHHRMTPLPPGSFLESLWLTLITRLGSDELTVDHASTLLGRSRQTLQRRLKASGTSLTQELVKMKQQHAIGELLGTDKPVAEVGEALGFHSPVSFTRAFKSWTGQSPREYRKAHESSTS